MSEQPVPQPSFFDRVINNDSTKKGLATAAAGILIGFIRRPYNAHVRMVGGWSVDSR